MSNKIFKILIFLIFFSIVLIFFLIFFIIPRVKEYKTNRIILNKYERLYQKEQFNLEMLKKKKKLTYQKYKDEILKYDRKFDKKDFLIILKKYLKKVSIKKIANNRYKINGELDDIAKFYLLIDEINRYKNIIKVDFPVIYKQNGGYITISFIIHIINKDIKKRS